VRVISRSVHHNETFEPRELGDAGSRLRTVWIRVLPEIGSELRMPIGLRASLSDATRYRSAPPDLNAFKGEQDNRDDNTGQITRRAEAPETV
jgi:hypothetical protein